MNAAASAIVLLRGLTREARHWRDLPRHLGERLGGRRVTALDLPGNGTRVGESSPWQIAGYVDACRRQARELSLSPRLHLVALSLGGMVALEWARLYPGEVDSCVLINTSLRPLAPLHWRLRPGATPSVLAALVHRNKSRRERRILKLTSRRFAPDSDAGRSVVEEWAGVQRESPVSRTNAVRQLIAASRYACAAPPTVPLLLLASTHDALVDVRCSRAVASRWGARLHEHASAGHDLPLDDPAWVIDRLEGWLREQDDASRNPGR